MHTMERGYHMHRIQHGNIETGRIFYPDDAIDDEDESDGVTWSDAAELTHSETGRRSRLLYLFL